MNVLSRANLNRTVQYLRRNGLRETWYAAREAVEERTREPYSYEEPGGEELERQREWADALVLEPGGQGEKPVLPPQFSILVPAYRTEPGYLREMLLSVLRQSYRYFELILADASGDGSVRGVYEELRAKAPERAGYDRIRYVELAQNGGISANTNAALELATGDYVALLDHDDLLAPDALYHIAQAIVSGRRSGERAAGADGCSGEDFFRGAKGMSAGPLLIYTDEDKCDADGKRFYEPNRKPAFDPEMLLSNNYVCHLLAVNRELARKVGFRSAYDGAQDYDFILRIWRELLHRQEEAAGTEETGKAAREAWSLARDAVAHIPRVLYHWRCYGESTAENPASKQYAYDAGKHAIEDFVRAEGWDAEVLPLRHLGFYEVHYLFEPFVDRPELGAIGGRVVERRAVGAGRMAGGRLDLEGNPVYGGIPDGFSGYLHRAVLEQEAEALDIRCLRLRKEFYPLFQEITGVPYRGRLPRDLDWKSASLALSERIREKGYRLLYYPRWVTYVR